MPFGKFRRLLTFASEINVNKRRRKMGDVIVFEERRTGNPPLMAFVNRKFFLETLEIFESKYKVLSEIIDCAQEVHEISWEEGSSILTFNYCEDSNPCYGGVTNIEVNQETMKILGSWLEKIRNK